ncbi:MAG: biotin transporter BioY [Bifidobacteriaceae bacterium]|jgi:biotin transport system substrate-specific component|nr:biotin transporter BioY [Bifidobacteriaceae bacterium]
MSTVTASRPLLVLGPVARARVKSAALVLAGAAWVAALGQVSIPLGFTPVPLSLGTFAVLSAGSVLGAKRGAAAMVLFLAAGALGAPVFAGHQSGLGLPTLGYVLGYILAASVAGCAVEGGLDRSTLTATAAMAAASALVYLPGVSYLVLATPLGWADGIAQGMIPFLLGDLAKVVLAVAILPAAAQLGRAVSRR